jgi:hypothetical protein
MPSGGNVGPAPVVLDESRCADNPMKHASPRTAGQESGPTRADPTDARSAPSARALVAALAGMAAAWLAAGSTGLLAHPLRHGLTWVALGIALVAAWPKSPRSWKEHVALAVAVIVAVAMSVPAGSVVNVLAVVLVLAMLARAGAGQDRRLLLVTAFAAAVLAVWGLAQTSIPTAWSLADRLGWALGKSAERISGKPLWVGATFGGLDFLVLMAALYAAWLVSTRRPRLVRAVCAAVAILLGHLIYLVLLACATDLHDALPPPPPPPEFRDYIPPPWSWSDAARSLLPWNLPILAGVIQVAIAAVMFRWAGWRPVSESEQRREPADEMQPKPSPSKKGKRKKDAKERRENNIRRLRSGGSLRSTPATPKPGSYPSGGPKPNETAESLPWSQRALVLGPVILAVLLPLLVTFAPGRSDLRGKKIVAYEKGYLRWDKPAHDGNGEGSARQYGMLPGFVASLGGRFERSSDLSPKDLDDAEVLVLIHPNEPWPEDQLERIWGYVRGGGSLLVLAETPFQEGELASSFNDVLKPTAMHVRFDTAVSETESWQHAYAAMAHPAVTGIGDRRNRFGFVLSPSIRARWPARPLLVGRWGWSDPGIDAALTGVSRFDAGEQLGDLVLAAEQRLGRGRVVVLSDTSSFTSEGNVTSYVFTGRLLAYLAQRRSSPQAAWRQGLGLLACVVLLALVAWPLDGARIAAVAVALALALAGSRMFTHVSARVLPDGRKNAVYNNVAYIDASHLEAYSDNAWEPDGTAGLALTLMRNGYLTFRLPELTSERLERAGMLISIAPARSFSARERRAVRKFVEDGGIFIATVGAEHAGPIQPLLEDFGLGVPRSPLTASEEGHEPKPMGAFPLRYRTDEQSNSYGLVYIYAGWPVECPDSAVLLRGPEGGPVASWHQVGRGKVVLIGDSAFATNKNFEYSGTGPSLARSHSALFWRWLITHLTDQEDWIPPDEKPADTKTRPGFAAPEPAESGAQGESDARGETGAKESASSDEEAR